jgi:hypothetical protein
VNPYIYPEPPYVLNAYNLVPLVYSTYDAALAACCCTYDMSPQYTILFRKKKKDAVCCAVNKISSVLFKNRQKAELEDHHCITIATPLKTKKRRADNILTVFSNWQPMKFSHDEDPAISVPYERLFSAGAEIATDWCNRLGSDKFEQLQVMKHEWHRDAVDQANLNSNIIEDVPLEPFRDYLTWETNLSLSLDDARVIPAVCSVLVV